MTDNNVAVAIMSFERPDMLQQCLESLQANRGTEDYDFIIFQDGAVNPYSGNRLASEEDIETCKEIARNIDLPHKDIRVSEDNLGTALMRDKVLSLFDEGYDTVLQVEDDAVLGEYALQLLYKMTQQFPDHLSTVYRQRHYDKIREPKRELNRVRILRHHHLYTFGMTRTGYDMIQDRWDEYVMITDESEYHDRDRQEILDSFKQASMSFSDNVLCSLFVEAGTGVVRPQVSRAMYLGGDAIEHGNEGPLTFDEDAEIDEWLLPPDYV